LGPHQDQDHRIPVHRGLKHPWPFRPWLGQVDPQAILGQFVHALEDHRLPVLAERHPQVDRFGVRGRVERVRGVEYGPNIPGMFCPPELTTRNSHFP
jgi:hypothetical protein